MSAEQDLLNSISLIVDQAVKSTTKIYTGIVDSVDTIKKTCDVIVNQKTYTVAYYGVTPSVYEICRIFSPENNFSNAFIIVGGTQSTIVNLVYPIGSIYLSVNNVNPTSLFGGTWEQIDEAQTIYVWKRTA